MTWRDFWNGAHSIYVNERHKTLHYDRIGRDIAALIPSPHASILDYGCGEAIAADFVGSKCERLYLYDAAPTILEKLRLRFGRHERIIVLSTEALDAIPEATLDMVVANSLLQYLTPAEFEHLLDLWRSKLKPGGLLVVADLIPPDVGPMTDAKALLKFAWQGGFFLAALWGLVATFFSHYRKLRDEIGLTNYAPDTIQALLAGHGFARAQAMRNFGHHQSRMTFVARSV